MGKVMMINGSPRAPRSNSRQYAKMFQQHYQGQADYYEILKTNHQTLIDAMQNYDDVLLFFPLYVDSLPVSLLNFLKNLALQETTHRPVISLFINCGFYEWQQTDIALSMMKIFCQQNHYTLGAVFQLGSGEGILKTPFRFLVGKKIKSFGKSIQKQNYQTFHMTMPIPVSWFVKSSRHYWLNYGKQYGITQEDMETMLIEDEGK